MNIKEHIQDFMTSLTAGDADAMGLAVNNALMDKVSARLEDMKVDIAQSHFNTKDESVEDLDESSEPMSRQHLEHIAAKISAHKDDEHLHSALKDLYHAHGASLNSNFRHDYFEQAANGGKGSPQAKGGTPSFTKTHKLMMQNAVELNSGLDTGIKFKMHDFHTSVFSKD